MREEQFSSLLAAEGITLNGDAPSDVQITNWKQFADRKVWLGTIPLGEAYMDNLWDTNTPAGITELFCKILRSERVAKFRDRGRIFGLLVTYALNRQSKHRSRQVAEQHYDFGNAFYRLVLDPEMVYSCGYWKTAISLAEAQTAKLDLICRKLELQPGERLLDIGCGWGSLAYHAAKHYDVSVVGVTLSNEQAVAAREKCAGFDIEIKVQDYRDVCGRFDKVVSVGMFEHVGHRNYITFMETVQALLDDHGKFLLHTIMSGRTDIKFCDPWVDKYIFPGGSLPSHSTVMKVAEGRFRLLDTHVFGRDYELTLTAWADNLE